MATLYNAEIFRLHGVRFRFQSETGQKSNGIGIGIRICECKKNSLQSATQLLTTAGQAS